MFLSKYQKTSLHCVDKVNYCKYDVFTNGKPKPHIFLFSPSSSRTRSFPLLSIPDVCELPWLVVDELQVRRGLCGARPGALKLSVSMPDVCELPWLVVEWWDRRLGWDTLPLLLPLAWERLSSCSMSSSRASLMYDSRYCFFSAVQHFKIQLLLLGNLDQFVLKLRALQVLMCHTYILYTLHIFTTF